MSPKQFTLANRCKLFLLFLFTFLFGTHHATAQYCQVEFSNATICGGGAITKVSFAGIDVNRTCFIGGGYRDMTNNGPSAHVYRGNTYQFDVTVGSSAIIGGVAVWIDFDNNLSFDSTEKVYVGALDNANRTFNFSGNITIPQDARIGYTRMRIVGTQNTTPTNPCGNQNAAGEANDYLVYIGERGHNNLSIESVVDLRDYSFCEGTNDVKVKIRNNSYHTIYSFEANWSIDGVIQPPYYFSGTLDTIGSTNISDTTITLGTANFLYNTKHEIKVWIKNPNSVTDTINDDDTILVNRHASLNCAGLPQSCIPSVVAGGSTCRGGAVSQFNIGNYVRNTPCINGARYVDYKDSVLAPVLLSGNNYPFSVTIGSANYYQGGGVSVWIDFNRDGILDSTEKVVIGNFSANNAVPYTYTSSIKIPAWVSSGYLLMRITGEEFRAPQDACANLNMAEAHDYYIYVDKSASNNASINEVLPLTNMFCQGVQDIKARLQNTGVNSIQNVTINWSINGVLQNTLNFNATTLDTIGGAGISDTLLTIGQHTFTAGVFDSIKVWTSYPNNILDTANYDDTLLVVLTPSIVGTCAPFVLKNYCTPTFEPWASDPVGGNITNVTFAGINKNTAYVLGSNYYNDFTRSVNPGIVSHGKSYPISVTIAPTGSWQASAAVWIDFDQSGTFDANELVHTVLLNTGPNTRTGTVLIPISAKSGYTVMRVLGLEDVTNPSTINPCNVNVGASYGEAQDYVIKIEDRPLDNAAIIGYTEPRKVCPGINDIHVKIENRGRNIINFLTLNWSINDTLQQPVYWNNMIDTIGAGNASDTIVNIGQITLTNGKVNVVKVWTEYPNNNLDAFNEDDTLTFELEPAVIGGTYTIGAGGDFTSFNDAAQALNQRGTCGNITFNVAAGTNFNESPIVFYLLGENGDSVTFRKTGTGVNPIINATGSAAANEAAISLMGVKNVTFDGIDIRTPNNTLEFGYKLTSYNGFGSSDNTIKNSKIILNRTNTNSIGIVQSSNNTYAGAVTSTSNQMSNHNNKYLNITVENSYHGIILSGATSFPDTSCVVGAEGNNNTIIGANTSNDIGNGASNVFGILFQNIKNGSISNCIVRNVTTTTTNANHGIMVDNSNALGSFGTTTINNNTIYNLNRSNGSTNTTTSHTHGIRIELASSATANVYNNIIHSITSTGNPVSAVAAVVLRGITYGLTSGSGTANFYHNTISLNVPQVNRASTAFWRGGTGIVTVKNNIFSNTSPNQTGVAKHYVIYCNGGSTIQSNNNLLWVANTNGFIGYNGSDRATFGNWQTAAQTDFHSMNYRPAFVSATDLAINAADTAAWAVNGRAEHNTIATTDFNNTTRPQQNNQGTPDIGAFEVTPTAVPPRATVVSSATASEAIKLLLFANDTIGIIRFNISYDVPNDVIVRQYSGEFPAQLDLTNHKITNCYSTIHMAPGNYNYTVEAYYKHIWQGSIVDTNTLFPAVRSSTNNWTVDANGTTTMNPFKLTTSTITDSVIAILGADELDLLPVTLVSFTANKKENDVQLQWITTNEENNKGFEIERSSDGVNFETIGFVASGKNNSVNKYNYTDYDAFKTASTWYYRLKQVDYNSTFEYSKVVVLNNERVQPISFYAYPNPFNTELVIDLTTEKLNQVNITITDMTGRVVYEMNLEHTNTPQVINTENILPGVYFLKVSSMALYKTIKLVKP
jgi:hypothetical protein